MAEQRFYDQVASEIELNRLDKGLWTRAFSESLGNEARARAIYISLRVARLEADEVKQRAAVAAEQERRAREEMERRAKEQADAVAREREVWAREAEKHKLSQDPLTYAFAVAVLFVVVMIFIIARSGT